MAVADPPTLDSVAARAGVSRQTVSNALHHPDRVAAATRDGCSRPIRESRLPARRCPARQLATRRAHAIAVRADRAAGRHLRAGARRLLPRAGRGRAAQRPARACSTPQPEDEAAEVATHRRPGAHRCRRRRGAHRDQRDRRAARPPRRPRALTFCAFGRPWGHDDEPHDWVDVDGAAGTGLAVDHLLDARPPTHRLPRLAGDGDAEHRHRPTPRLARGARPRPACPASRLEARSLNDAAAAEAAVAELLDRRDAARRHRLRQRHPRPRRPPRRPGARRPTAPRCPRSSASTRPRSRRRSAWPASRSRSTRPPTSASTCCYRAGSGEPRPPGPRAAGPARRSHRPRPDPRPHRQSTDPRPNTAQGVHR